ncbi:MAG: dimethyl sulfoxide reductase anchor subunit [Chloroflexi bacterium]|nr:dimethyl sulfoxide reductase anchor subunit [Chloroflexota bacterium]
MNMNLREWALPVYTILMQLSVGVLFLLWLMRTRNRREVEIQILDRIINTPLSIIGFTVFVSIIGSHFHLSRPLHSFLAVLNFRHSWLSREIAFTVLFIITLYILLYLQGSRPANERLRSLLGWVSISFGMATIYCMSNIYLLPAQAAWDTAATVIAFFATTFFLGAVATTAMLLMDLKYCEVWKPEQVAERQPVVRRALFRLVTIAIITLVVIYINSYIQIAHLRGGDLSAQMSMQLLTQLYQPLFILRLLSPLVGITLLGVSSLQLRSPGKQLGELLAPAYISCILVAVGEILGRFLFYATHVRTGI